jgi:hypothetical protein
MVLEARDMESRMAGRTMTLSRIGVCWKALMCVLLGS